MNYCMSQTMQVRVGVVSLDVIPSQGSRALKGSKLESTFLVN